MPDVSDGVAPPPEVPTAHDTLFKKTKLLLSLMIFRASVSGEYEREVTPTNVELQDTMIMALVVFMQIVYNLHNTNTSAWDHSTLESRVALSVSAGIAMKFCMDRQTFSTLSFMNVVVKPGEHNMEEHTLLNYICEYESKVIRKVNLYNCFLNHRCSGAAFLEYLKLKNEFSVFTANRVYEIVVFICFNMCEFLPMYGKEKEEDLAKAIVVISIQCTQRSAVAARIAHSIADKSTDETQALFGGPFVHRAEWQCRATTPGVMRRVAYDMERKKKLCASTNRFGFGKPAPEEKAPSFVSTFAILVEGLQRLQRLLGSGGRMTRVESALQFDSASYPLGYDCKIHNVKGFSDRVSSHFDGPADELGDSIAKINEHHFIGEKHARIIQAALDILRSLCASELGRNVTDAGVLCICLYSLCSSRDRSFNMESMFNTKKMSPYEPLGNQNKAAWLMLKAVLSIDAKYAMDVLRIVDKTMPDLMGVLGVFCLTMQTDFGAVLFKCRLDEGTMPIANSVLSNSLMTKVLTMSLDKFESNRPHIYRPTPELKDSWGLLEEHILNTTEMSAAIVCRRSTTIVALLRVMTSNGFKCFARRMNYTGCKYCVWAKQCAKDLRDNLRLVLKGGGLDFKVPTVKESREIQAQEDTKEWNMCCVDETSYSNMRAVREAMERQESCCLNTDGTFTGLVATSFVSFVES